MVACLLAVYGDVGRGSCSWCTKFPLAAQIMYTSLRRLLMALGMAFLVFVCCSKQGGNGIFTLTIDNDQLFLTSGFMNTFLSWKAFIPLGKLTYVCYLIHPLVIYYGEYSRSTHIHVLTSTMVSPNVKLTHFINVPFCRPSSMLDMPS